jgi:alkylation response protein AidB-like acyl-CoA dehydrogenase
VPPTTAAVSAEATVLDELRGHLRRWVADRGAPAGRALVDQKDPDAAERCWRELTALGVLAAHLPDDVGGGGAGLPAAAVVLAELAVGLVPGPLLPTFLAGAVLAEVKDRAPVEPALRALVSGARAVVVVAADWDDQDGPVEADLGPIVGLADADFLLVVTARTVHLLDPMTDGLSWDRLDPLDSTRTLATARLSGWQPGPGRSFAGRDRVAELTAILAVAEATGIAQWCLDTAVLHAQTREQFGRPIGAFQAVNHQCVDLLVRRDRAAALSDAAAAGDRLAVAAAALECENTVIAAKRCIQLLGAVGFTWEHDAHLRLRRALANRQWVGPPGRWEERLVASFRADPVDLDLVRVEPDAGLRALVTEIANAPDQRAALADSGLLAPSLPVPWGIGAQPRGQAAARTALRDAGIAVPDLVVGTWALASITAAGTPEQCTRFVGATLRGELAWCQLFSEPGAGSDLASLRTRAVPVDGGWAITGHKIWTSRASEAEWAICLARVPEAGVTFFLVPMRDERVRVEPLRNLTGKPRFAEVFLDGVLVTPAEVVGTVGEGWAVARTTLGSERMQMSDTRFGVDPREIVAVIPPGSPHEPAVGQLIAAGVALRAMNARALGRPDGGTPEVRKLVAMAYYQDTADVAHAVLDMAGLAASEFADQLLDTRGLTIGGGTTEVLTTAIGERVLGLPRGRRNA